MNPIGVIVLLLLLNKVICRSIPYIPVESLNELVYSNQGEQRHANEEPNLNPEDSRTTWSPQKTTAPTANLDNKSYFEEYVWLDNALQIIFAGMCRMFGLIIKKYILKMPVSFADVF
jgi:hypothetical protein